MPRKLERVSSRFTTGGARFIKLATIPAGATRLRGVVRVPTMDYDILPMLITSPLPQI